MKEKIKQLFNKIKAIFNSLKMKLELTNTLKHYNYGQLIGLIACLAFFVPQMVIFIYVAIGFVLIGFENAQVQRGKASAKAKGITFKWNYIDSIVDWFAGMIGVGVIYWLIAFITGFFNTIG